MRPNPYEAPGSQETNIPCERIFCVFPPVMPWRSHPLATCSDSISLGWCDAHVAAPNTYGLSTAITDDSREPWYGFLRPRNLSVPSYRPTQKRGCISLCASACQVRVRGSTQQPSGTSPIWTGARVVTDKGSGLALPHSRFAQILRGFKNCGRVSVVKEAHHGRDPENYQPNALMTSPCCWPSWNGWACSPCWTSTSPPMGTGWASVWAG